MVLEHKQKYVAFAMVDLMNTNLIPLKKNEKKKASERAREREERF